jgi:hypothetical protein
MAAAEEAAGRTERALAAYRQATEIIEALARAAPGNAGYQRRFGGALYKIAEMLFVLERPREAVPPLTSRLAIVERMAAAEPANAEWQGYRVVTLFLLAKAGDEPKARLVAALAIARQLAAQGHLDGAEVNWIERIETALAELPS